MDQANNNFSNNLSNHFNTKSIEIVKDENSKRTYTLEEAVKEASKYPKNAIALEGGSMSVH